MMQMRDVAHHKLRTLLAPSDLNIERCATGIDSETPKDSVASTSGVQSTGLHERYASWRVNYPLQE